MPETSGTRTYTTVLFDLDGTLLPMDTHDFMQRYFASLTAFAAKHGIAPEAAVEGIMQGIRAMGANDGTRTNHDVFWDAYSAATESDAAENEELFSVYYRDHFHEVGDGIAANPAAAAAVNTLKSKGYTLAVATMPMFPIEAVHERIRWAGLNPDDFMFVTDYETNSAVKPMERFYEDVLKRAGADARHTLMVGNHNREDGNATKLGCDLYLVTDYLIEADDGVDVATCKHGSMQDFATWCEGLPHA